MIVRTYGRRNRSGYSDSPHDEFASASESDGFADSLTQETPQDIFNFGFSSQDSFDFDPFGPNSLQESRELAILPPRKRDSEVGDVGFRKLKTKKVKSKKGKSVSAATLMGTATLMETQEFGEMMEHVDEERPTGEDSASEFAVVVVDLQYGAATAASKNSWDGKINYRCCFGTQLRRLTQQFGSCSSLLHFD
ncbi:hypothetical protein CsSME_00030515 [Camellia sinensis var. sinensis]